jgi:hypothetical protein
MEKEFDQEQCDESCHVHIFLENCPLCGNILEGFEFDAQVCEYCGWSEELDGI